MGELAERMRTDLKLRGKSPETVGAYLRYARAFAAYHRRSPRELGAEDVRAWFAHLVEQRGVQPDHLRSHIAALKFLYGVTLGRPEVADWLPWPKKPRRLPEILSAKEVARLLAATPGLRDRCFFMAAYGAGLRVSEVVKLQTGDIDSQRGAILVRAGKGNKDRLAPLPRRLLVALREWWRSRRPPGPWLFPGSTPDRPLSVHAVQDAFHRALRRARIRGRVRFHSLRHAYATHLLEGGTDLFTIQHLLGHTSITTSTTYLHTSAERLLAVTSPLDRLDLEASTGTP